MSARLRASAFFFFNDPATTEIYTLSLHDALPLFVLAIDGGTFQTLLLALMINAMFQSLYTGTIPSILAEMFPTPVRYTGLSVSYGFAVVLFGGFAPLISTWLVEMTGNPFAPAFYIMT